MNYKGRDTLSVHGLKHWVQERKGHFLFSIPGITGIHRNPKQKGFYEFSEGFLRAGITKYSKAISALSENEFQLLTLHVILGIYF